MEQLDKLKKLVDTLYYLNYNRRSTDGFVTVQKGLKKSMKRGGIEGHRDDVEHVIDSTRERVSEINMDIERFLREF